MERINRGDIVLAAVAGDYGKPRPWVVVQADRYNAQHQPDSVLACPFTTYGEALPYRIAFGLPTGLETRLSWVMVDKLMAIKRERIKRKLCALSPAAFLAVEEAMKDLLGLV